MNKILSIFYILSLFVLIVFGIYEEEIGKRDWSIQNIGQFENSLYTSNDNTILVHSKILNKVDSSLYYQESHVLSLLSTTNGNTQKWRQLLPIQEHTFQSLVINNFDNNFFLTLSGNKIIRYWNRINGDLIWSYDTSNSGNGNNECYQIEMISKDGIVRVLCKDSILFIKKENKQVIVLSNINNSNNSIYKINGGGDNQISQLDSNTVYYYNNAESELNLIEFSSLNNQPTKLNKLKLELKSVKQHFSINKKLIIILSEESTLNIISDKTNVFTSNLESILPSKSINGGNIKISKISPISNNNNNNQFLIKLLNGDILIVEFNTNSNNLQLIKAIDNVSGGQYSLEIIDKKQAISIPKLSKKDNGLIENIEILNNKYILISMSDWSINLYKLNTEGGIELLWTRNEALSFILSSEIIDYPLPDISKLAQLQYEFNETDGFFAHFSKRIQTQIKDIFNFGDNKKQESTATTTTIDQEESIKKIIIVSTLSGKIFGLNSQNGKILWSKYYSNFDSSNIGDENKIKIFTTKKTIYESPEVAIVYPINEKPKSVISFINPLNGIEYSNRIINHRLLHSTVLSQWSDPITHSQMMYWVVNYPINHPSPMVTLYPWNERTRKVWSNLKSNYFYLINQESVKGYGIESLADGKHGGIKSIPIWNLQFNKATHQIIASSSMNPHEVIQSPAIILGNRNLLPKYINRNMIVIAVLDTSQSILTINLIDSITGEIIKSLNHQHSSNKVSIVQTENSVVYSHYDLISQTQLISSIDIFEKNIDWKTQVVSSFNSTSTATSDQLIIKHKTFVFVNGLIKTLSLSITDKGITSKHILVGLTNGQILPIDKKFINARRPYPSEVTPEDAEEQLIPYKPMLQFPPWYFTTYNTTVTGLTTITSTGTDLESTSLVFAYGQPDVFCVLITPSLPYDILSDQFNHISLIITSVTLLVLVFVAKNYKNSLILSKKWK